MENHLGELWSLFNFLMPGFLGESASFAKNYRTPIEKRQDQECRADLVRRISPFMLRRTKDKVAKELPAKTEIIQFSQLEIGQVYRGRVSGVVEFGVFVSMGLLSGLIHKTKMGNSTPNQFTIGDDIEVEVLEIDFDKDRLSLAFNG